MAGLLDIFNSDDGMQGLGLLAAAGPSMQPQNLASRLAMAGQTYKGLQDDTLKQKLLTTDLSLKALAEQRAQQAFAMQQDAYYGSPSPGATGGAAPSAGMPSGGIPSAPGAAVGTPALGGGGGPDLDKIRRMAIAGVPGAKEALEIFKYQNEPLAMKAGDTYVNRVTGARETVPILGPGQAFVGGKVVNLPGATSATMEQTLATEAPKALLNSASTLNLRKNPDGTETPVPALSENPQLQTMLQQLLGGRSGAMPAAGTPAHPIVSAVGQKAADSDSLRILQEELKTPNLTESDKAGISREIGRLQFSQTQPGFPTPSLARKYGMTNDQAAQAEADKRLKVDLSGGVATDYSGYKSKLASDVDTGYDQYRRNQMIRQLLKDYQTGLSGSDARMTFASNLKNLFPGNDTARSLAEKINGGNVGNAQELANVLSAAGLTSVIRTLDGNGRVNKAEYQALQQHAETNRTDPSALEGIMSYQDNIYKQQLAEQQSLAKAEKEGKINPKTWRADYAQIRHEGTQSVVPPTPAQGQASQQQPKAGLVNELPKVAPKGARARDTATGQIMVFNGMSWTPEKR